jgi:hypothetical protein
MMLRCHLKSCHPWCGLRQVSGPVVVKVCLIVLGVMGIVILLDASVEEGPGHPGTRSPRISRDFQCIPGKSITFLHFYYMLQML